MAKIPFTLEAWLKDKSQRVETRDGRIVHNIWPVEPIIVCGKSADVCALIDGEEDAFVFFAGGKYLPANVESPFDLFIVTPEEELSEFEERIFKLLRQYKERDIPLTPENIKADASMLWSDFEKYFFVLYGKDGEGDSALRSFYYRGLADGKAEALKDRAVELTKQLNESGLDENSIEYNLIEFMCNLMDCPNWSEIVETAGLYAGRIKAEALKDVPRWGKSDEEVDHVPVLFFGLNGDYLHYKGCAISVKSLEKLPGFKED